MTLKEQNQQIINRLDKVIDGIDDLDERVFEKNDQVSDDIRDIKTILSEIRVDYSAITKILIDRKRLPISYLLFTLGGVCFITVLVLASIMGLDVFLEKGDGKLQIKNNVEVVRPENKKVDGGS